MTKLLILACRSILAGSVDGPTIVFDGEPGFDGGPGFDSRVGFGTRWKRSFLPAAPSQRAVGWSIT